MQTKAQIATPMNLDTLVHSRTDFDSLVYTPFDEAIAELHRRREDPLLEQKVSDILGGDLPKPLTNGPTAVTFRQVTTPNYETRRFFSLADSMTGFTPLYFEYLEDKFVSCNDVKHALGKLSFYHGRGKKGGVKVDTRTIIDFNSANGKPISEIKTHWGQSLVDFHHELFVKTYRDQPSVFFDASAWFKRQGAGAVGYYRPFLSLFVRHAVLFEDFLLNEAESDFTRDIFLPAFLSIEEETGVKPLIVNMAPPDTDGRKFWMCYPHKDQAFVEEKLRTASSSGEKLLP